MQALLLLFLTYFDIFLFWKFVHLPEFFGKVCLLSIFYGFFNVRWSGGYDFLIKFKGAIIIKSWFFIDFLLRWAQKIFFNGAMSVFLNNVKLWLGRVVLSQETSWSWVLCRTVLSFALYVVVLCLTTITKWKLRSSKLSQNIIWSYIFQRLTILKNCSFVHSHALYLVVYILILS